MKITKTKLKEIIKDEIQKLDEFRRPPQNSSSILPIGIVDLKTGANKILDNVYDVWPKSYVNVFKNLKNKYVELCLHIREVENGQEIKDKAHFIMIKLVEILEDGNI